jgi:hypothetical protein
MTTEEQKLQYAASVLRELVAMLRELNDGLIEAFKDKK